METLLRNRNFRGKWIKILIKNKNSSQKWKFCLKSIFLSESDILVKIDSAQKENAQLYDNTPNCEILHQALNRKKYIKRNIL